MKPFVILAAMLITSFGFSQTQRQAIPLETKSNQERYKIDYELKDFVFVNGDSSILNSINIDGFDYQRNQTNDVEIFISDINRIVILYSYDKMIMIRSRQNQSHSINHN